MACMNNDASSVERTLINQAKAKKIPINGKSGTASTMQYEL